MLLIGPTHITLFIEKYIKLDISELIIRLYFYVYTMVLCFHRVKYQSYQNSRLVLEPVEKSNNNGILRFDMFWNPEMFHMRPDFQVCMFLFKVNHHEFVGSREISLESLFCITDVLLSHGEIRRRIYGISTSTRGGIKKCVLLMS